MVCSHEVMKADVSGLTGRQRSVCMDLCDLPGKRVKRIFTFLNSIIYPRDTHAPIHLSLSVPSPPSSATPCNPVSKHKQNLLSLPPSDRSWSPRDALLQHLWIIIPTPAALPLPRLGSVLRIFLPGGLHQPHRAPCLWGSSLSYGSWAPSGDL